MRFPVYWMFFMNFAVGVDPRCATLNSASTVIYAMLKVLAEAQCAPQESARVSGAGL